MQFGALIFLSSIALSHSLLYHHRQISGILPLYYEMKDGSMLCVYPRSSASRQERVSFRASHKLGLLGTHDFHT